MLTKKKWAIFSLLTLCGGTIYKLPSLKDAFYIPMQEFFHLTNGQIGNAMSVNSFVTTIGFFLSIYFADKLPRKYTMSFSLIATGLLGIYLSTMPGYWGILLVWALFGVTCDMLNWPVLLKSISMLGDSSQQGRLFGFFETGRGVVDTVVAFSALGLFAYYGSGLLGFKAGIWFYSGIAILVGIFIPLVLNDSDSSDTADYRLTAIDLFKAQKFTEARNLICSQIQPEEFDDMYRFMYQNIKLWANGESEIEEAILIIRDALVKHSSVADPEINLAATFILLSRIGQ